MNVQAFRAAHGGGDFIALRPGRAGGAEIVYDDGVTRRRIWRVTAQSVSEARIVEALRRAAAALNILPAIEAELKKRAIAVERVA